MKGTLNLFGILRMIGLTDFELQSLIRKGVIAPPIQLSVDRGEAQNQQAAWMRRWRKKNPKLARQQSLKDVKKFRTKHL